MGEPDCRTNPCELCIERAKYADIFVGVDAAGSAHGDSTIPRTQYVCGHCIPTHSPAIDIEYTRTQVWEVGSDGWLAPICCMDCGSPIDVTLGDDDEDESEDL